MIPKVIFIAGFFLMAGTGYGQSDYSYNLPGFDRDLFHLGYYVGLNTMNFVVEEKDGFQVDTRPGPGLCVGLASSLRLSKYLEMKFLPGLSFGERDVIVRKTVIAQSGDPDWHAQIESVYIDIPLHLKYRAKRDGNFAPYIFCGIAPKFDIYGGEIKQWKKVMRLIKIFDYFPELGFGIDFYLFKVKMSTDLRFSVGQMNIYTPVLEEDAFKLFDDSINSLRSNIVTLSVQFLGN